MGIGITRRQVLLGVAGAAAPFPASGATAVIETHVHLFDPQRVPYAADAPYKPPPYTLEQHTELVKAAGLAHSIIVHPEPYQDDHRYLEYAFEHEPRPGYFKGTCLFDPLRDDTPRRVRALMDRRPKRIVAMRIHAMSVKPEAGGPIRNRDLRDPRMARCWRALSGMGLAIQMHFIPAQAGNIYDRAAQFPDTMVILDHMGRSGQGTEEEYRNVLKMAKLPRLVLKFSNWADYKGDLGQLAKRLYDTFGPDRMIWGGLGNTLADFRRQSERFEQLLAFAPESDRAKIRGENARRLFFA
jgi:predicted TIM-barrel fold metal-dependent hydrolase